MTENATTDDLHDHKNECFMANVEQHIKMSLVMGKTKSLLLSWRSYAVTCLVNVRPNYLPKIQTVDLSEYFLLEMALHIQPVSYKRYFRCNNCFLLLVYTMKHALD